MSESSRRADEALGQVIKLWKSVGDRPFKWYVADTTGEAVIRNSYFHPRNHIAEHLIERGDPALGHQVYEQTAAQLRRAGAPGHTLGPALYNLARSWVADGRLEEGIPLLEEVIPMRSDLAAAAARDPDLAGLRSDPRFLRLIASV